MCVLMVAVSAQLYYVLRCVMLCIEWTCSTVLQTAWPVRHIFFAFTWSRSFICSAVGSSLIVELHILHAQTDSSELKGVILLLTGY